MAELLPPINGLFRGGLQGHAPELTSEKMNNVRARCVLEGRMRIGQRPGLAKKFGPQIGGAAQPIVELLTVSASD